jgi:hypothetical protein
VTAPDAPAVLWNGEERVCDARFSMEVQTPLPPSTTEASLSSGVLVVNATLEVDRRDIPRVTALHRDRAPNLKVTVGRPRAAAPLRRISTWAESIARRSSGPSPHDHSLGATVLDPALQGIA